MNHQAQATLQDKAHEIGITLDGRHARLIGRMLPYGIIATTEKPALTAEFSWTAIERIINNGGAFKS